VTDAKDWYSVFVLRAMIRLILLAFITVAFAGNFTVSAQAQLPETETISANAPGKKKGSVAERVLALVVDLFGDKAMAAQADTRFVQDLGGDRLDIVLLVMSAEEEFAIDVPDAELGRIETVGDLTDCVRKLLAEKRGR
jgi:acyl carrier protein